MHRKTPIEDFQFHLQFDVDDDNGLRFNGQLIFEEVVKHILSFVHSDELLSVMTLVCKRWCNIIKSDGLWITKYQRHRPSASTRQMPWYVYYNYFTTNNFDNLIKNGNGYDGFDFWNKYRVSRTGKFSVQLVPREVDPLPENIPEFYGRTCCFATTKGLTRKVQLIPFRTNRLIKYIIRRFKPHIYVSEWVAGTLDFATYYCLYLEINYKQTKVEQKFGHRFVESKKLEMMNLRDGAEWRKVSYVVDNYRNGDGHEFSYIQLVHEAHSMTRGGGGCKMAGGVVKFLLDTIHYNPRPRTNVSPTFATPQIPILTLRGANPILYANAPLRSCAVSPETSGSSTSYSFSSSPTIGCTPPPSVGETPTGSDKVSPDPSAEGSPAGGTPKGGTPPKGTPEHKPADLVDDVNPSLLDSASSAEDSPPKSDFFDVTSAGPTPSGSFEVSSVSHSPEEEEGSEAFSSGGDDAQGPSTSKKTIPTISSKGTALEPISLTSHRSYPTEEMPAAMEIASTSRETVLDDPSVEPMLIVMEELIETSKMKRVSTFATEMEVTTESPTSSEAVSSKAAFPEDNIKDPRFLAPSSSDDAISEKSTTRDDTYTPSIEVSSYSYSPLEDYCEAIPGRVTRNDGTLTRATTGDSLCTDLLTSPTSSDMDSKVKEKSVSGVEIEVSVQNPPEKSSTRDHVSSGSFDGYYSESIPSSEDNYDETIHDAREDFYHPAVSEHDGSSTESFEISLFSYSPLQDDAEQLFSNEIPPSPDKVSAKKKNKKKRKGKSTVKKEEIVSTSSDFEIAVGPASTSQAAARPSNLDLQAIAEPSSSGVQVTARPSTLVLRDIAGPSTSGMQVHAGPSTSGLQDVAGPSTSGLQDAPGSSTSTAEGQEKKEGEKEEEVIYTPIEITEDVIANHSWLIELYNSKS